MEKIDKSLIGRVLVQARQSPRRRSLQCLNTPQETLQRMVNAGLYTTYVRPHKHENPDKTETFTILQGRAAVLTFDNAGEISDCALLDEQGDVKVAGILPRTWHSFVILSPEAALYEIIEGKYDPVTHKNFASWAPEENNPNARLYLENLRARIESSWRD